MNADVKGALNQINVSWKAFVHNGKPMTKRDVKRVLEYALSSGYEHTGQLTDFEIDRIIYDYPKHTTKEQWDNYYANLKAHEQHMDDTKPMRCNFQDDDAFHYAMVEWERARFCDAPNKPGYYRANND